MPEITMTALGKKALVQSLVFALYFGVLIFVPAGTLRYWEAWIFLFIFSGSSSLISLYLYKNDPALLERRMKLKDGEKERSQKIIQGFAGLCVAALIAVSTLDHRMDWSIVPTWIVALGDVLVLIGFWIFFRVMKENTYASSIIEIDPSQTVISTGPYAMVRHPMYSGAILLFIGTPLALGSWWGLVPALATLFLMVVRLLEEEKFLKKNLNGYSDYCQRVTYRLIPRVW